MNDSINVPISLGELWDKYSILIIKKNKIKNNDKLKHIDREIEQLEPIVHKFKINENYYNELLDINTILWDIEDTLREKEKKMAFDEDFIYMARCVYINNDKRAHIKSTINKVYNSLLVEVKDYCE